MASRKTQSSGARVSKARVADLVAQAAAKFKARTFEDPLSLQRVGRSRGIYLNKQLYSKESMKEALRHGMSFVPHSRRPLNPRELTIIDPEKAINLIAFEMYMAVGNHEYVNAPFDSLMKRFVRGTVRGRIGTTGREGKYILYFFLLAPSVARRTRYGGKRTIRVGGKTVTEGSPDYITIPFFVDTHNEVVSFAPSVIGLNSRSHKKEISPYVDKIASVLREAADTSI